MGKNLFDTLLNGNAFNVRVSKLSNDVQYSSIKEKLDGYVELVRDSLGTEIVTSNVTFIGNYTVIKGDGDFFSNSFQLKGCEIVDNLKPSIKKSVAIRINIRLKQGGFKSWVIIQ